jgi:ribosomal protein S18 acetylase RimI-like enzyme
VTPPRIVDANASGRTDEAARLVFEYMAMTQGENGLPVPASVDELPPVLSAKCRALSLTYSPPGALFLACVAAEPIGCVGRKHVPRLHILELKRLSVRSSYRGRGAGRALVRAAPSHAVHAGVRHVVLDVMPNRTDVVEFYQRGC